MADLLGHGIDLTCSSLISLNSSDAHPYNTLQWLDGEIPIESSASREIIRCGNSITLRFHNFSTLDFGMYKCRCDYGMDQFCSQPSGIIHLPEGTTAPQKNLVMQTSCTKNINVQTAEKVGWVEGH